MSVSIEALLESLRTEALRHGAGWVESQVRSAMPHLPSASVSSLPGRAARRSRPPERLSPECTPRARRRRGSPRQDPPASASESALGSGVRAGRNPSRRPSPAVILPSASSTAPLRRVRGAVACAASPSDVPGGGAASPAAVDVGAGSAGQRRSRRARTSPGASREPRVSRRDLPVTAAPCSVGGERLPQPRAAASARMTSQGVGSRRRCPVPVSYSSWGPLS